MTTSAQARSTARHQATRTADATSDPEYSPLQPLAGSISELGESSYASTYAGVQISGGVLDIYVVPGDDSAFLSAVAALDTANLPFTVVDVSQSYATQSATSEWLADNDSALQSQGINPGWWGSDPADNAIRVALQSPTSAQLTELQATAGRVLPAAAGQVLPAGTAVTLSNYLPVAAAVLNAQVPSQGGIVVYPTLLGAGQQASGYDDTTPFYGADQIKYTLSNTATCTSNFSFNGAVNPNNHWVFTAAHCSGAASGHNFYTCASSSSNGDCNYNVGTVSTVYYNGQDFESIGPSSNAGYVWNDSNASLWSVNGYFEADPGVYVTVDGEANGAHYGNYVIEGGGTTCVSYSGHLTCNAIVIETGTSELCIPGDSGGPVLQRESDGYHIYAVGMILGFDNTSDGDFCYAQQISYIRNTASVRLIWGN